jgi:hypothetical protein
MTNKTSGLLDLYPLYGATEEDTKIVRVSGGIDMGRGFLLTDAFFEEGEGLEFVSPATSVLLILFNRNHNVVFYHNF